MLATSSRDIVATRALRMEHSAVQSAQSVPPSGRSAGYMGCTIGRDGPRDPTLWLLCAAALAGVGYGRYLRRGHGE